MMGIVYAFHDLPVLIKGMEGTYKMTCTVLGFLTLLPPIFISGFAVACAVTWKKSDSISNKRFSQAMFDRFRNIFFISIGLVFILTLNEEIFVPAMEKRLEKIKQAPAELQETLETTGTLLSQGHPIIALQFAKRAVEIAPKSQDAIAMLKIAQEVIDEYEQLKKGKDETLAAMIFVINKDNSVSIEKKFPLEGFKYDDFLNALPDNECRYGIYRVKEKDEDMRIHDKIAFILWCPLICKPQQKMPYSQGFENFKDTLGGQALQFQPDDKAGIAYEILKKACLKK